MRRGTHTYPVQLSWTGNKGEGTSGYRSYERSHVISAPGKPPIPGSSDPVFRGDRTRYNPEELLVAALSACHMLAYLHMCADAGVVVTNYTDDAVGTMVETPDGGGHFTDVVLRPTVTIAQGSDPELAQELHHRAHDLCFIASSVNFPVRCEGSVAVEIAGASTSPGVRAMEERQA
jgi:organic hydroperoxide reductase OsmC/OhrA